MTRIHGWDISLNHGAVVELVKGKVERFAYYTDIAGAAGAHPNGSRLDIPTPTKQPDRQVRSAMRLEWVSRWLDEILRTWRPDYVGLEDYAIRAEQGAHYLGEIGGQARRALWSAGVSFRLHDPIAVKMFVAHDGTAQKDLIEATVKKRWRLDFSHCNAPRNPKTKKEPARTTSEDLADAVGMAHLVWAELLVRTGELKLSELHEKEIQVFNRTTKANPINLLGREWLKRPGTVSRFETCSGERCSLHELVSTEQLKEATRRSIARAVERGRA